MFFSSPSFFCSPWILGDADRYIFNDINTGLSREEVLNTYIDYAADQMERFGNGGKVPGYGAAHMLKPVLGLFHETYGSANWRFLHVDLFSLSLSLFLLSLSFSFFH